jgi:HD-GYP domain-containing protein (c-di-GMP phosphodiesterase class II)
MRLVALRKISPGAILAQPVYGPSGLPLLNAGVELNTGYLDMLKSRHMQAVYVEDPDTADIEFPQPLSPELRAKVTANLGHAFTGMTENDKSSELRQAYVAVAKKEMEASRFANAITSAIGTGGLNTIARDMDSMLDELKGAQVLTGLNSIKTHDSYTFQHSIDVTIMGLVLARQMNWERHRLRAFGIGCMLHDLGKLFIDPAILNKNGKLTDEEYTLIKAHPAVGYDAIKSIGEHLGALAPHVAFQHHERQDGKGYPRGIKGTNLLGGNEKGMIHDFGSIAAVADVYDAMTSNRPYRAGWSPARAIAMIKDGSGTHFNRQAVNMMMATVPSYPVYSEVSVRSGKFSGWRGIVSEVSRLDLNRPTIRVMFNPAGTRVEPVEINLRKEGDIEIDAIAPEAIAAAA